MASTYPTSLDSFTNPLTTNPLTSPSHAQQHSDINDAMEAVQTKLAIGNTVIGTWIDYTPTWTGTTTNPVIGNGSIVGRYSLVNKTVTAQIFVLTGSTTTYGSGDYRFSLPVTAATTLANYPAIGNGWLYDTSANSSTTCVANVNLSGTTVFAMRYTGTSGAVGATTPFTFASGDFITATIQYKAA